MPMTVNVTGTPPVVGYSTAEGVTHLTPAGVAAMLGVAQTYLTAGNAANTGAGRNLLVRIGSYSGGWPVIPSDQTAQMAAARGVLNAAGNVE